MSYAGLVLGVEVMKFGDDDDDDARGDFPFELWPLLPLPFRTLAALGCVGSGGARRAAAVAVALTGLRPLTSEGLSEAGRTSLLAWRLSLGADSVS